MKLVTSIMTATVAVAGASEFTSSVVQVNTFTDPVSNVTRETSAMIADIGASDSSPAPASIMGRTVFQLVADEVLTQAEIESGEEPERIVLDEDTVASYLADGTVSIIGPADDPFNTSKNPNVAPRTKYGEGYTVVFETTGLENPAEVQEDGTRWPFAATNLKVQLTVEDNNDSSKDKFFETELDKNGTDTLPTSVNSDDSTTFGRETYRIFLRPDADNPKESELDSASIVVFPRESGSVSGITAGETYEVVPEINVDVQNMYPDGRVFLRVTGPGLEEPLRHGFRRNTEGIPKSHQFELKDLDRLLEDDGRYFIDLRYADHFGRRSLIGGRMPFTLQRVIRVRGGSIFTAE